MNENPEIVAQVTRKSFPQAVTLSTVTLSIFRDFECFFEIQGRVVFFARGGGGGRRGGDVGDLQFMFIDSLHC